ncbi:hypothetical protein WA026_006499 [Henosepilachna vigintioctopunctata]|uniref:Uncharacterized protein n=1 Tax=Henosepilachna vigintioctopunctata TaxID=420089 RepID=A0AAW1UA56_9CUCU
MEKIPISSYLTHDTKNKNTFRTSGLITTHICPILEQCLDTSKRTTPKQQDTWNVDEITQHPPALNNEVNWSNAPTVETCHSLVPWTTSIPEAVKNHKKITLRVGIGQDYRRLKEEQQQGHLLNYQRNRIQ